LKKSPIWQKLDFANHTLDKIDRKVELFEKLMNDLKLIKTSKQIIPYLDWLRNKTLERNETFRYLTLYLLLFSLIYHTVSSPLPNQCYYTAKDLQDDFYAYSLRE
jgi:hypothetical protein